MTDFGKRLRAFFWAFARGSHLPITCWFVASVLADRFAFPRFDTAIALFLSAQAYDNLMFVQKDSE